VNFAGYFPWIAAAETAGILSAFFSRDGMRIYRDTVKKPPLSPPAFLFPVVWSILYALMGIGAARVYKTGPGSAGNTALNVFVAQLVVNFFWPLLFFNAGAYGFALLWLALLWALVFWMILTWRKEDPLAAWLQIPYLLWLSFAVYLNAGVWFLNK
jgi:tryptophan-rich sensory protein